MRSISQHERAFPPHAKISLFPSIIRHLCPPLLYLIIFSSTSKEKKSYHSTNHRMDLPHVTISPSMHAYFMELDALTVMHRAAKLWHCHIHTYSTKLVTPNSFISTKDFPHRLKCFISKTLTGTYVQLSRFFRVQILSLICLKFKY